MSPKTEVKETVLERCANQAARAVTQEIERHTGQPLNLYMSIRIVNCIGAALEKPWHEGGQMPGEIRAILEEEYKPEPCTTPAPHADTVRLQTLRKLCGYIQDGSGTRVAIGQDDASGEWYVSTPGDSYYGNSMEAAIDAAKEARG